MNRRMAIVGLDIFVLLALPILLSGRPGPRPFRPAVGKPPAPVSAAYLQQINQDYAGWVDRRLQALRESADRESQALRAELEAARRSDPDRVPTPSQLAEWQRRLRDMREERDRLADELEEAQQRREATAEEKRRLRERTARLEEDRQELRSRTEKLADRVEESEKRLGELRSENEELQTELDKRLLAETGGHIAAVAGKAHGRVGVVTSEVGLTDRFGFPSETFSASGMAVPVRIGGQPALLAHASALNLTGEPFAGDAEPRISHFSVAVMDRRGDPNWVTGLRFLRGEKSLVVLRTEREFGTAEGPFQPAPHDFLLKDTVIVLARDGTFFQARFAAREGYVKLTSFKAMEFGARWIKTSQQSPGRPGDLILDHHGNLVGILVSTTLGRILPDTLRTDGGLSLPPELRERTEDPSAGEKRELVETAGRLKEWINAQERIDRPFHRD